MLSAMETPEPTFVITDPGRLIVVEPIVALSSLFGFPLQLISQLYILDAIRISVAAKYGMQNISHDINTSIDLCHVNKSDPIVIFNAEVQKEASYFVLFLTLIASVPALFMSVLLGTYSDKAGRKYAILPPLVGGLLSTAVYVAVVIFNLSIWYLLVGAILNGLGGYFNTLLVGCFAYISDTTSPDNRRFRITILEMFLFLPGILGSFGAGNLLQAIGYKYCFVITLVGQVIIIIYVIFFVPETVQKLRPIRFFDLVHMKRMWKVFALKDASQRNRKLLILLLAFFTSSIPKFASGIDTLFLKDRPLCMSNDLVGYYSATAIAVATLGGTFVAWILKYCFSNVIIALIAGFASVLLNIYKAFVQNSIMMFLSTPFGMFTVLYIPTVRTLMSTAVNNSEQGVIFGAISAVESICAIIGTAIFNPIYANTQTFMTGFVFIVMAMFFMSGCCVLLVYIICYWQKDDQNQHPVPNSKEEPPTEDLDDETEDDRRPILSSDTAVVN